jgi:hypothetical protein
MFGNIKRIKDVHSWFKFVFDVLGYLGLSAFISGLIASIGGGAWAVIKGVPIPIAAMAAYCTFVCGVYLMMIPLVLRKLTTPASIVPVAPPAKKQKIPQPPNYAACRLVSTYRLDEAAHLWCDIDPNDSSTYDTIAWEKVLRAKIQEKVLKVKTEWPSDRRMQEHEITEPGDSTRITRLSLQEFAKSSGFDPKFLRDKD